MLDTTLATLREGVLLLGDGPGLAAWATRDAGLMHLAVYLSVVYAALSALPRAHGC